MELFHFFLACMSFNQLAEVHFRVCSHRHPRNISHHVIYLVKIVRALKHQILQWEMTESGSADSQAKRKAIKWEQKVSQACLIRRAPSFSLHPRNISHQVIYIFEDSSNFEASFCSGI